MSVQNPERVVTKQDLADFYEQILPYLGGMPEILANKFSKSDMYSTDEKMIGQWIDGKPLYSKTKTMTIGNSSGWQTFTHGISNIGTVIESHGFIKWSGEFYNLPHCTATSGASMGVTADGTYIYIQAPSKSGATAAVTLTYTKSTDSAVSIGNDTDYSTDEKIVGTWIDGRPIWQKSVQLNSSVSLTQDTFVTLFNLSDYSMDKLIGITLYNSSSFNNPLYNFITWLRDGHCDVRSCGITWNVGAFTIQYTKTTS